MHTYAKKEDLGISKIATVLVAVIVIAVAGVAVFLVSPSLLSLSSASGCSQSSSSSSISVVPISITNGASSRSDAPGYSPDIVTLVIGVNNTVTWTNDDSAAHTLTSSSAPSGASFNSGNMNIGATCTHTFTVPGTYRYFCKYHSWMTGTIVVKAGS